MYTSPDHTYICASRRSRPRPYVHIRGRIFFLAPWPLYVRVHATCAPLLRHVRASTSTSMYVHVHDQNDNATYASTWWVPTVGHFLACEDVAGGSQQSGGRIVFFCPDALPCVRRCSCWVPAVRGESFCFFCPDALPCVRRCSWWVPAVRGRIIFFVKYGGPSGGSPQSGGGIIILRVIRRHFLAAAVDPAVSLSTYSPRPMDVVP